jgi:hypothetical protein
MPFKQATEEEKADQSIDKEVDYSEVAAEENPEDERVDDKMRKSIVSCLTSYLIF